MSLLGFHVGQCGIQLGEQTYDELLRLLYSPTGVPDASGGGREATTLRHGYQASELRGCIFEGARSATARRCLRAQCDTRTHPRTQDRDAAQRRLLAPRESRDSSVITERGFRGEEEEQEEEDGPTLVARAVLVDTEPKVVQQRRVELRRDRERSPGGPRCGRPTGTARECSWTYGEGCSAVRQSGAANNWAAGFLSHGPAMEDEVFEAARRFLEAEHRSPHVVIFHSAAGAAVAHSRPRSGLSGTGHSEK
eukprot:GHVU01144303.1.p2 GENE.GHVU01144303.1~~GHVU01144303.1.p2  ORF type:complete len:251 (+),score=35.59 GHVU01144303.1:108-860(+)